MERTLDPDVVAEWGLKGTMEPDELLEVNRIRTSIGKDNNWKGMRLLEDNLDEVSGRDVGLGRCCLMWKKNRTSMLDAEWKDVDWKGMRLLVDNLDEVAGSGLDPDIDWKGWIRTLLMEGLDSKRCC